MGGGNPIKKIIEVVKKVVKAVVNVFTSFLGAFGMGFDTPDYGSGADYEAQAQGITVNKQSNVAGIPVIYGKRKVGGVRTFVGTRGTDNKYLYVCLAVAEGEINRFTKIYINDEPQSISSFSTSTVNVNTDSKYYVNGSSRAQFQFFRGTEDQGASSLLKEHPSWNDNHRLRGVAYVACRFEWVKAEYDKDGNQTLYNPWQGIPKIQVEIEGRKVLSGNYSSHGTTNTNTYGSEIGSFTYSNNPADCLLDYLRNTRYGKGLNDNRIDWGAFRTAQQTCNTNVNFGGSLGSADFLDCNTFVKPEDNLFNNTKKLLQTCRGFLPYVNGKYVLKIETAESTPSDLLEITDDMIIGKITINSPDKAGKFNECHITYSNEEKNFEADTAIYKDTTFLAEDDGESLILKIGGPGITRRERALDYAEYMVRRSRKQLQLQLTTTSETQQLVAGELCTLTHTYSIKTASTTEDRFGYMFRAPTSASYSAPEEKIWRVVSQKLNYDGTVDLILLEHQNDIYDVRVQQEDRDLSAYNNSDIGKLRPTPTQTAVATGSARHFTVESQTSTVNGITRPILFINNNRYEDVDANAVIIHYRIVLGSNTLNEAVSLPNHYGSGFNNVNGTLINWNDTITVNISSEYRNGQVNPIEQHTITMPANPTAAASGGI